jgi:hypothetical protein
MVMIREKGVPRGGVMGWSMSLSLYPKSRTSRLQRLALSRLYSLWSRCIQLQRLAHRTHRTFVQPVQVGLLAENADMVFAKSALSILL